MIQQKNLDIIANNLANANTVGYKGDMPVFRTFNASRQVPPAWTPDFVALTDQAVDFSQGPLMKTENPLDIAIAGEGFFEIQTPQGLRYTRKGDFAITDDGNVVTQGGDFLMGEEGPVVLTEGEIDIDQEGVIWVDGNRQQRIRVVTFPGTDTLVKEGDATFAWPGKGSEVRLSDQVDVRQGYLESSNVNPVREMVHMIDAIRTYEVQQKVIHSFDDTRRKVVEEVGRLR